MDFQFIALDRIVEDPDQPRKAIEEEALAGLAGSIKQHGVLNPITVAPLENVDGFWDGMIAFLDHVTTSGFMSPARRGQLLVAEGIGEAIDKLGAAAGATEAKMVW